MSEHEEMQEEAVENLCKEVADELQEAVGEAYKVQDVTFNFRTTEDADGNKYKRPSLTLPVPLLTAEGIVEILEAGGKQLELLLDAAEDVITKHVRAIISEDENISCLTFPYAKVSWEAIANMPRERRGGGIPKEHWEAFGRDYLEVMPGITGKDADKVNNAKKLLLNKFSSVKTNKKVIQVLLDQLAVYADNAPNAAEYADCIAFLNEKGNTLLNSSEEELLAAL